MTVKYINLALLSTL